MDASKVSVVAELAEKALLENGRRLARLWDEYAYAGYENVDRTHSTREMRERMDQLLVPSNGDICLDAGCGTGGMFEQIARITRPTVLYGVDWSEEMLRKARTEAERIQHLFPQIRFELSRVDLVRPLDWNDGFFDSVVSSLVVCYLPYGWKNPLSQLRRVLKVGGYLYLSTFLEEWSFKGALLRFAPKEFLRDPIGTLYGIRFRRFAVKIAEEGKRLEAELPSQSELISFLETLGFQEIRTVPIYWGFGLALRARVS